eukprot:c13149_g1_i1.p1 GENE.c13149_g1_i1~~c13149_g1_i1.p1  ORF type:complete len:138 (+),score=25.62 c13149_g1_i1:174-587(+)
MVLQSDEQNADCVRVSYMDFMNDDQTALEAVVELRFCRPCPPSTLTHFESLKVDQEIDVRVADCWWEATALKWVENKKVRICVSSTKERRSVLAGDVRLGVTYDAMGDMWQLRNPATCGECTSKCCTRVVSQLRLRV